MKELLIILAIVLAPVVVVISLYNRLVKLAQNRENAFSDIDVQLKQRLTLVPQLVEVVKGYAKHETNLFKDVTAARAAVNPQAGVAERSHSEAQLSQSLMNLFAVAEAYPDLKANTQFQTLQQELSDIENKIAASRRYFNNATNELNTACKQFPTVLFAQQFGFSSKEFFEAPESAADLDKSPEVKF